MVRGRQVVCSQGDSSLPHVSVGACMWWRIGVQSIAVQAGSGGKAQQMRLDAFFGTKTEVPQAGIL
jgi:hypothetical protein